MRGGAHKDEPRKRVKEVRHCVEVAETLGGLEAASEEGVVGAQDLNHAASPPNSLLDVTGKALGSEPSCLWNVDVSRVSSRGSACGVRCARLR